MTATTIPTQGIIRDMAPGFGSTLVSEWTKLRTVRSTWILIGLAIGLSIGVSALVALVLGLTTDPINMGSEANRVLSDPIAGSTPGLLFSLNLLIVFGVTAVSSEYSSGTIRTTFIVNPHRLRVWGAKSLIVGLIGIGIHTIAVLGMFLVSQAIYGAYDLETASIMDSDAIRFLLAVILIVSLVYTLIPLSLAFVLRGTASSITVAFGFLFLSSNLATLLPAGFQQGLLRYLPDIATNSLTGLTEPGTALYLNPPVALIVVIAWLIGFLVTAAVTLTRRDV